MNPRLSEKKRKYAKSHLVNLLTNAAKYTDAGGRIWLTASRDPKDVVVKIRDTGVGLTPELLPRIFDLFAQRDRSAARSEGGLGIGLTLVKSFLRTEECCETALIIAVSGYGQEDDIRRSRGAGFDRHLIKPVDFDSLMSLLSGDVTR